MRNTAPAYQLRILACLCMAGLCCARPQAANYPVNPAGESISVTADFASEDRNSRSLQVEGNVRVAGADWEFTAERATLEGTLEDAEELKAQGSPARIFFTNDGDPGETNEVEGLAREIRYRRHDDILHLRGGASLRRDSSTLTSEDIEYRREKDLFKAGGAGGVRLTITPAQRRSAESPPPR